MKKNNLNAKEYVESLVNRARIAQKKINYLDQETVDNVVGTIAYKLTRAELKHELADFALRETELGDYTSKINKIEKKVKGVYRDIKHEKTVGIIEEIPEKGLLRMAKPVGVIGAVIPSTQPEMLPITKAMFALKCRNAMVFSPHPRGKQTTLKVVKIMRGILKDFDLPEDLLVCTETVSLDVTNEIMRQTDLIVATGGAGMVKSAYSSGTPAYGVGAGNANLFVSKTANLEESARNTMLSKVSDLAAGCSCDNALIIEDSVYSEMLSALEKEGGYLCTELEKEKIQKAIFPEWPKNHALNRDIVAKPVQVIAKIAGIEIPEETKFIMVKEEGSGENYPLSGEKMCLVLTIYKAKNLQEGIDIINANHAYSGAGHSCGIYSTDPSEIEEFAKQTFTARVNVNLPNSYVNTGDWQAGYPFSGSIGCGTWGGNIVSENISLKHFMNNTWIANPIEGVCPSDDELFGDLNLEF
ncbi:aldehyde dehydrogenase family protein [Enterococcus sp. DIV0756]|uniref:aldehyde dehydrogenase family protein n=1 Tax=Enterococcus sp. DIV0756 TaxID=2774636 RepID=UPI003F262C48